MYIIGEEEAEAVRRVIETKQLYRYCVPEGGSLQEVVNFEKEWAAYCGAKHAITMTSGTSALICALAGAGIGPGHEVIIPGYTFVATALAVLRVGAIPVIVDVDESTTIDVDSVAEHISPMTRAVIPVDMCGMPCNMDAILELARAQDLIVIEDACQAAGGTYKGRFLGTMGNAGTFSFNLFKIITAGESGALVTDDTKLYERAYVLHDGGCFLREQIQFPEEAIFAGENYRNNEISAAVLRVQLKRLPDILSRLRRNRAHLVAGLKETEAVRLALSHDPDGDCGVQLLLTTDSEDRTRKLIETLLADGIPGMTPIDSGRHVYSNWEPLMQLKGAHHPALDPFQMEANKECAIDYSPDMLPRTTDILKRSVQVVIGVDWDEESLERYTEGLNRAIEDVSSSKGQE